MKALITGQSDFSLEVLSLFDKESRAISRSSGHDIEDENVRKEIALESLKYDILILVIFMDRLLCFALFIICGSLKIKMGLLLIQDLMRQIVLVTLKGGL